MVDTPELLALLTRITDTLSNSKGSSSNNSNSLLAEAGHAPPLCATTHGHNFEIELLRCSTVLNKVRRIVRAAECPPTRRNPPSEDTGCNPFIVPKYARMVSAHLLYLFIVLKYAHLLYLVW